MSSLTSRFIWADSSLFSKPIDASLSFNRISSSGFLKNKESAWNMYGKRCGNLQYLSMLMNLQLATFVTHSNIKPPPEPPLPSGSPSGSLKSWIVGIVLTFILPFCTHKWGPLLLLKNKVGQKIETTLYVVKAIGDVAERVDQVIDSITDDLPDDSQLKKTLERVDAIVEGVAKTAQVADGFFNKVEEAEEDKLESSIHQENWKGGEIPQEDKDKEDKEITAQPGSNDK